MVVIIIVFGVALVALTALLFYCMVELGFREEVIVFERKREPIIREAFAQAVVITSVPNHESGVHAAGFDAFSPDMLREVLNGLLDQERARREAAVPFKRALSYLQEWETNNPAPVPPMYFGRWPRNRRPLQPMNRKADFGRVGQDVVVSE